MKIYAIDGYSTSSLLFGLGKAQKFRAEFTGGRPDLEGKHPATFAAKSMGQEIAIEHSPAFKSGFVYLYRDTAVQQKGHNGNTIHMGVQPAVEEPVDIIEQEVEHPAADIEVEPHPEITKREDVVAFLKGVGAKAATLRSVESIQRVAASLGYSFPNWEA